MKTLTSDITYQPDTNDGVFGRLSIDGKDEMFLCGLPYRSNALGTSRLPNGIYSLIPHNSPTHGFTYKVMVDAEEPEGRSDILIHTGNHCGDIEGCMVTGMLMGCLPYPGKPSTIQRLMAQACCDERPLNIDSVKIKGLNSVQNSRVAFKKLRGLLGDTETHKFIIAEDIGCPTHY